MVIHVFFFKVIFVYEPPNSLAVFYKINKLAIIKIILLNVTHVSLIFHYYLVLYILFCFNNF